MRSMKARAGIASTVAALSIGAFAAAPSSAAFKDKDCSDFNSRKQAQKFFKNHKPNKDPHGLDADHDGKACETTDY